VDELELRRASGDQISTGDLYAALRLRAEVFVIEQDCNYLDPDGGDLLAGTTHLWLRTPGGVVASYVRVLAEPTGGHRIGRVVTAPQWRGRRLAARLLHAALEIAADPVVLHAQSHLVDMYARHGFVVDGPEYLEDEISHTPMRLPPR
jgi:ElaA protein